MILFLKSALSGGRVLALLAVAAFLVGCADNPGPYAYRYVPGKTARLTDDGQAVAPPRAPDAVFRAIAAGNRIAGSAYVYGGGHGSNGGGFDCSGSASYLLRAAGRLHETMTSEEFRHYGEGGEGRWMSVYARHGHVFLVVAGLRFDTGWTGGYGNTGPRWTTHGRPTDGCVVRHPEGL